MSVVQTILAVVLCALLGMFVFYLVGAVISCGLIWPRSNLCGVVFPAMIAAPVGLVAGGIAGWLLARRLLRA